MTTRPSGRRTAGIAGKTLPLPPRSMVGYATAVFAVLLIALLSWASLQSRAANADLVTRTLELLQGLDRLQSTLVDAETGQRGFLLTGRESYLEPYANATASLAGNLRGLRSLTSGDTVQQGRLDMVEQLSRDKLAELNETITLRRANDAEGALAIVRSDRGRAAMNRIRSLVADMREDATRELTARQADWQSATWLSSAVSWGGSALLLVLILTAAMLASREYRREQSDAWLKAGQLALASRIQGDQRLETLGEQVLAFLVNYLDAQVGALYAVQADGSLVRSAVHGVDPAASPASIRPGEGLLGQALKDGRAARVRDVPHGHLSVVSSTGRSEPAELLIAPAGVDGTIHAVVELGFFRELGDEDIALVDRVAELLGIAVRGAKDRSRLEELLEETQRQGEELQAQQEELRVSNEELEEQTRALQLSRGLLESQQAELEQSNAQLEEQAQALENQRDELSAAHTDLVGKADELERSNQHKSEFLANMSHELRTPLNSTLILSKLLADNKGGNLTAEQVKFAQTISSAGNDLLYLINDVLDLAKIEAGKVEVHSETVSIARTMESLSKAMKPLAEQKGLVLSVSVDASAPESLETDGQRLNQILRNLLSNALKFTERGSVWVQVASDADDSVSFVVKDTGIGISPQQHDVIFEAFRQADGSTHRKYGGTGLGLSISRDLARLLGGEITLDSQPGVGSSFTLRVARHLSAQPVVRTAPPAIERQRIAPSARPPRSADLPAPTLAPIAMEDDRAQLDSGKRLILVIEDDVRFAAILRDLCREMGFQCVVTHTADDGLLAAERHRPSAILLDMNLPDHSGLSVLDELKRNSLTRHIPVHVASVADYSHEAMELGAVGYALKPVKREQLVEALQRLESKFTQRVRSVLVVEDDARQRESIGHLLASDDVSITMVERASEALAKLQETTFDCVVMDLNLPDLSGYDLLEQMAQREAVSFPPVIVYTGRTLNPDDEQKLRRFSKSIIIKDARSPERLLDEVTLFLHQVESALPAESQRLLKVAREREHSLDGRRVLVVEDDVRNVFALSKVLEPKGIQIEIARNGREAIDALTANFAQPGERIDLVLMDIMMPEMDGYTAMREIRKRPEWKKLPIIALTAKAMPDDHERCIAAGANDYIAKPLDVERLLSLVRVWMPK